MEIIRSPENNDPILDILKYPSPCWDEVIQSAHRELMLVREHLLNLTKNTWNILPPSNKLFRALDLCYLPNVKIVILGQDPYHTPDQANGLSFSTEGNIQPSLRNIYNELKSEYGDEFSAPNHGDLTWWAQQGVLLLNTCLTVNPHQPGSHGEIWNGFIAKVLLGIQKANPDCVYMMWGAKAHKWATSLRSSSNVLMSSHPSPLSANRKSRDIVAFMGSGHFKEANEILIRTGKVPINWSIRS